MKGPQPATVPRNGSSGPPPRRVRTPGLVYGGITVAMLVLLAAVALTTRQPPPPSIAEFAPQAVEQIKDAPTEQSSQFGSGEGGSGLEGEPTPAPAARESGGPKAGVDVPRVRRCVGNPPRQTEDPQSPPCVPYWEGDNGGATSKGVTKDQINIFIPTEGSQKDQTFEPLKRFFNKRFEFYGRQLNFIYNRNDIGTAAPETQKAEAQKADEEAKSFASQFYRASQGLYYHEELARRKVVSATGSLYPFESSYLQGLRPYLWQYPMEAEKMFANAGEWTCKRLVGGKAVHGGDDVKTKDRVFGVIMQTYYDIDKTDTKTYEAEMARCGHPIPQERKARNAVRSDSGGETTQVLGNDPASAQNVMLKMQGQGVTTIFCPCNLFTAGALTKAATNQGYFPEWIFTTYGPMDINIAPTLGNSTPEQMAHAMGLSFQPKQIQPENEPYWWALSETDPGRSKSKDSATVLNRVEIYRPLLLLASGIQMAGPDLTPETFEKGLQRAIFPNPDHPNKPGKVGFGGGSYGMTLDGTEIWWSNGAASPYQGDSGAWCYVDGGRRYTKGTWPKGGDPFFNGACDSGA